MRRGRSRDSRNCTDLVCFLGFGGFRKAEAANITLADCDLSKGEILVRGDLETGTKNWSVRRVPMISDMRTLLKSIRSSRPTESPSAPVMLVKECQKAMDQAARLVGMTRITHHDLRHLFAMRCIESGVYILTVARWLGRKDGGALATSIYGHLRDGRSQEMVRHITFTTLSTQNVLLSLM